MYLLLLELRRGRILRIGELGRRLAFPRGFYLYVGSAQRNLPQRLARHLCHEKALHWHIDYLLTCARICSIYSYEAPREWECRLSQRIAGLKGVRVALKGFGSSDCSCQTHLYYSPTTPGVEEIVPKGLRGCAVNVGVRFIEPLLNKDCSGRARRTINIQSRASSATTFDGIWI